MLILFLCRYTTNKRTLTVLEDTAFGLVGMVCVGSTMVGSIELTSKQGRYVKKYAWFINMFHYLVLIYKQG